MPISLDRLKELLTYNPESGEFRNNTFRSSRAKPGDIAGCRHNAGYWKIRLDRHYILAHRLAWFYVFWEWPDEIDHINGDRSDNRIANLRPATHSQNMSNKKCHKTNMTGLRGVSKRGDKYRASVKVNRKRIYLGSFDTAEAAHGAYLEGLTKHHGEFAAPKEWRKSA